jgi:7-keto-8-aminopelargonate synthetase-like enzyme
MPLDRMAECVTSRTTLVAVSAVQSADGRVADLDALHAASRATGARVLLDTTQSLHRHALGLANRFRTGIGLDPEDSAIVSLATNGAAADAMAAARITGSARADRLRLSFHVSTSDQDADLAADVLRRHVSSRPSATL